jgi:hypothetical protein
MTLSCPECGLKNKVSLIPGGFYFNQAEYKCVCGFYIATYALNFSNAKSDLKRIIKQDRLKLINECQTK